jgi:hypothetical protein
MRKRILLIAPEFFNYHKLIMAGLKEMGWEVVFISDRPPVSSLAKIGIRKARFLFEPFLNSYYQAKLSKLGRFERVLIIKGEGVTVETLKKIREFNCESKITLYLWDGIQNVPGAVDLSQAVDDVFTFDTKDALKYGFKLQPLFFVRNTVPLVSELEAKWPISFVGSVHSDRLKVVSRFREGLKSPEVMFVFIYFPSRLQFWFRKIFDPCFHKFSKQEVSLKSLDKETIESIFTSSKAVLDVQHPRQMGLTMRTIESLALGKKLITTNQTITEYPFYDPANILVIDRKNPVMPDDFLTTPMAPEKIVMMQNYEVKDWIRNILSIS